MAKIGHAQVKPTMAAFCVTVTQLPPLAQGFGKHGSKTLRRRRSEKQFKDQICQSFSEKFKAVMK